MRNRNISIVCSRCKKNISVEIPIGFKKICDFCSEYLHACVQCKHFDSLKSRCKAQVEEKPKDIYSHNFCDEYSVLENNKETNNIQEQSSKTLNKLESLFKTNNDSEPQKKKNINDLFKD